MDAEGTDFYAEMSQLATEMCDTFGRNGVTFSHYEPTSDPVTGEVTEDEDPEEFTASIPVLPVNAGNRKQFDKWLEGSSLVERELRYLVVPGSVATFAPANLDEVTIGSDTWQVIGVETIDVGGTPVLYNVGVAKL